MKNFKIIMQKFICIIFSFALIICPLGSFTKVYADTSATATLVYDKAYIRSQPSGSSTTIKLSGTSSSLLLPLGQVVTILNYGNPSKDSEGYNWYNIRCTYNGVVYNGYIREYLLFIQPSAFSQAPQNDYEVQLQNKGFPYTYWPYLDNLHAAHPNWQFEAVNTGLNWNDVIAEETDALGKSLIQTTNAGWKNLASYNYDTNTFANNYTGGGASWYAASNSIISYYMDPRNYLQESLAFAFSKLSYDPNYQNIEGIQNILKGTFMDNAYVDDTGKTYAQVFMEAGIASNVSPYFLASRVIQEIGSTDPSSIVSGNVSGYNGYYNFYNIKASGATAEQTIANGLSYAQSQGWNSRYNAIVGGAKWIANGYIDSGQDTLYSQKWDVDSMPYSHQYQQNIQAPATENKDIYFGYKDIGYIDLGFDFSIPVYDKMPATAVSLPNTASPIYYLNSISINDQAISGFNYADDSYDYYVSMNTTSVDLKATPKDNGANVTGCGIINLTNQTTTANIVVTAPNGDNKAYKVNIIKNDSVNVRIDDIINNMGVKYNSNFIWGLTTKMDQNSITNTVKAINNNVSISITDVNGVAKFNSYISTGDKITLSINGDTKSYNAIIYGDVSGDGQITVLDLLKVQKHLLGSSTFNPGSSYFNAADVSKDSQITVLDLLKIQKQILGSSLISQS